MIKRYSLKGLFGNKFVKAMMRIIKHETQARVKIVKVNFFIMMYNNQ